jgi:hypothetical protein
MKRRQPFGILSKLWALGTPATQAARKREIAEKDCDRESETGAGGAGRGNFQVSRYLQHILHPLPFIVSDACFLRHHGRGVRKK